jgi:lysophospholipase L1-like esterase
VFGLLRQTADKCRIAIPPPREGNRALVDVPAYTSRESTVLLVDFRRRLEAIIAYAERVGALPVLIAPPANDAGFEPNRSFLPAATPRSERVAFAQEFLAARRLEAHDPAAAVAAYRTLLARQPGFAETHYRLAQLLERAGDDEVAYRHYVAARDLDGYPMRCLTPFQMAYRDVAARHGCILVDGQGYFHAIGRRGLLDDHLFHDGIHPSLRGQIALAQAVLHALKSRGAFGWPRDRPAPRIEPAQCAAHFGMGPAAWRYICLWGIMFYDLCYPMRYDPSRRLEMKQVFAQAAERIQAGELPETVGLPNVGVPEPVPVVQADRAVPGVLAESSQPLSSRDR